MSTTSEWQGRDRERASEGSPTVRRVDKTASWWTKTSSEAVRWSNASVQGVVGRA